MIKKTKLPDLGVESFWHALSVWPSQLPLLALGGRGSSHLYLALEFSRVDSRLIFASKLALGVADKELSWPQIWGVIPYDYINEQQTHGKDQAQVFAVSKYLHFHCDKQQVELIDIETDALVSTRVADVSLQQFFDMLKQKPAPVEESYGWQASATDEAYLKAVEDSKELIRQGRFYQINLLRYFSMTGVKDWYKAFHQHAGPFSAWMRTEDFELVSFSPERFVNIESQNDGFQIVTEPIKGTLRVSEDPAENLRLMQQLLASEKDQAELHMIVDLMRNDLYGICSFDSVIVSDPGSLHSFSNVHHLIARIEGRLSDNLSLNRILEVLTPGGSITGAPKREVMRAISELEGRDRGFFMGNCIRWDPNCGNFDSSILIRTAVKQADRYEFAVGSGLVIHSCPTLELEELWAKGKVVGLSVEETTK
ncbi:MAG: chorismate-binding protein [Pseudobacteriovorax sp.]|nr:chorismate-binding protein [Pseudobacteriovorax sp.]